MSDIIEFMDWTALSGTIATIGEQVAGLSPIEAEAALNAIKNGNLYIANTTTQAGSSIINFPNSTAAEAAAGYIEAGGSTAVSGAATGATGASAETANLTLIEGAGGTGTGIAGLLSMPLPTVAAAIAPLAGVAIGAGLYTLSPDFWTKVSKTLLPFCYPDSELLPVTVDENGNTYYPKECIDALKDVFSELDFSSVGIPASESNPIKSLIYGDILTMSSKRNKMVSVSSEAPVYVYWRANSENSNDWAPYAISTKPFSYTYVSITTGSETTHNWNQGTHSQTTIDGVTYYMTQVLGTAGKNFWGDITPSINIYSISYNSIPNIVDIIYKGTIKYTSTVKGIDKWNGDTYPDNPPTMNVLNGYDENNEPKYTPYYPVSTPIGEPGVSNDPAVNPNPAVNPDPAPVINPVISPVPNPNLYPDTVPVPEPAPVPNPVPEPQPVPEPDVDPSEDTDTTPDKDPTTPKDPTDGGTTPTPVIPTIPTLPSAATGLLHVYNPTQSQIDSFGSWLWSTFSGDLIDTLSKLFNDPMDAVIGLHELYATPAVSGGATIRCGYLDSGINANLVGSRYTTINCGSVVVEEYYQNYLDYSPYTSCFIYLPFIGIVPVSSDDIIGNAVNITYHIDSYTGCCIAVVTVAKSGYSSTVYQFEGNCAVEIPISSGYQSSLMSGLLAVAGTAITSSPAIGMTAAHMGRAGLGKNTVQHSGSFGSSYGAMGNKVPYIIVKRPVQKKVYNYSKSYGFPAHKMVYVGNCQGYLRAKEVRVTSTTATNVEKDMIVNALTSGVYVK